jgi:glycosyltransferase involved in cell wall biosynthesis
VNPQPSTFNSQPILFAYSYAARDLFRWARAQGWRTVLGQIDAGPEMGRIVRKLEECHPEYQGRSDVPPKDYWEAWRDECELADRIIVNSEWSRKALEGEGIDAGKIRVVPLAYAPPPEAAGFRREYPAEFTRERPLRVLFLGQVNLAKGLVPLLEAAEMLRGEPVEFHMVGPVLVTVPEKWRHQPQIRWLGPVPRGAVAEHYRAADVFLFPTFSDGFGMTQLEAQAWQLPIVASQFCGDVVRDGVNGLRLGAVNAAEIAQAVRRFLASPEQLAAMSRASGVGAEFSLSGIAAKLEGDVLI